MAERREELIERCESFAGRHQDAILRRNVSGFARVGPDLSTGCGEECLGDCVDRLRFARGLGGWIVLSRQALDLHSIEDRVSLEEGNFALLGLAGIRRFGLREPVGVNNERAVLPLADMRAELTACLKVIQSGEL